MRSVLALVLLTVAAGGCKNHPSKLDADRGSGADALWDLAPDGTELGFVATPRAVGLALGAVAAVRELSALPDLAPAKAQIDGIVKGLFGSPTASPEDAGFAADQPFAMFATADGILGIMPVGDRDKFMASKQGQRGSAEDILEGNTCRPLRGLYICASSDQMFERIGKGSLRGKVAAAGARGDAELYMQNFALLGEAKGELALAAQLERGQVSVFGRWSGTPSGVLAKLVGIAAPRAETAGASGFVAVDVAPLLAAAPPLPLAGGVSFADLGASLAGPVSAVIPTGSVDIQLRAPLRDPKPAQAILAHCEELGQFFELAKSQTPGACRLVLQGTNALELDAWVEGNELRLGAKKGAAPAGKAGGPTPIGRELASGDWSAACWGRGTMLNLAGIAPATTVPAEVALGVHAIALVNELGAAAKVDATGVRFRAHLRTAWTNPPELVAKIAAISGGDIVTGRATEPAKAIAAGAPDSPFAADFAAGQGGLMIPAAAIGLVSAVVIPAVMRALGGGGAVDVDHPQQPAMGQGELALLLVRAYAEEAFPKWKAEHAGQACPEQLEELATYFGENPGIPVLTDPWNQRIQYECKDGAISVFSIGPDGKAGTEDDVRS
jgi:hypothetical protein